VICAALSLLEKLGMLSRPFWMTVFAVAALTSGTLPWQPLQLAA